LIPAEAPVVAWPSAPRPRRPAGGGVEERTDAPPLPARV